MSDWVAASKKGSNIFLNFILNPIAKDVKKFNNKNRSWLINWTKKVLKSKQDPYVFVEPKAYPLYWLEFNYIGISICCFEIAQ